jgi:hypothetical protein
MARCLCKYQWSYKYKECICCGTTIQKGNNRHKGNGLCLSCYEKRRSRTEKRKLIRRKAGLKYYLKNKDNEEYKEKNKLKNKQYRKNSKSYKVHIKKQYLKRKYKRFIERNAKGTLLKRDLGGIEYRCSGCHKNCLVKTNIREKQNEMIYYLEIFKKLKIKICKDINQCL